MRHLGFSLLLLALFQCAQCTLWAQGSTSGTTYATLNVTGTATITGTLDVPSNNTYFGSITGGTSAVTTNYYDGSSGIGATLTSALTRPLGGWVWGHLDSGTVTPAMALSASNQLILTGTQSGSPGSIVLDPTAGSISINGQPLILNSSALSIDPYGDVGIGTTSPNAGFDVEGDYTNTILNNGLVGIGGDPNAQGDYASSNTLPLYVTDYSQAGLSLRTTGSTSNGSNSQESIQFNDGPGNNLVGVITGLNVDYPPAGVYQPKQLAIWSGGPGGILIFARDMPYNNPGTSGSGGPIVFATGHYITTGTIPIGEAMRITPTRNVGIGTSTPQRLLDVNGFARFQGAIVASGTLVSGTYVTSGTNLALVPQQGDISMGNFTGGSTPQ